MSTIGDSEAIHFERLNSWAERSKKRIVALNQMLVDFEIPPALRDDMFWELQAALDAYESDLTSTPDRVVARNEMIERLAKARHHTLSAIAQIKRFQSAWAIYGADAGWEAVQYALSGPLNEYDLQDFLCQIDKAARHFPVVAHRSRKSARNALWHRMLRIYRRSFSTNPSVSASPANRFVRMIQHTHRLIGEEKFPSGDAIKKWLKATLMEEAAERG
ncbi:hypothetical protein LMIY3S_01809 [Labrys miyagiensis]